MNATLRRYVGIALLLTAALIWVITRGTDPGTEAVADTAPTPTTTSAAAIDPVETASTGWSTPPTDTQTTADPMESDSPDPVAEPPTWDSHSSDSAAQAAVAVISAYGDSDLSQETWWDQLSPLLTSNAQATYSWVDPAVFHPFTVTGEPTVPTEVDSAYIVTVEVPTSIGTMSVLLIRADGTSPWLADQILFPETSNGGA